MDLSVDQQYAYDRILAWVDAPTSALLTLGGVAGSGKGQPLSATIMTPFGPKTMGDMHVGSLVCNPDGTVAKVIQVHELGERDIYCVRFADGARTYVTNDHLWFVRRASKKQKAARQMPDGEAVRGRIETTETLREYIRQQRKRKRQYAPLIPLTKPVTYTYANRIERPIDPYVLGVLLGDGSFRSNTQVRFSSADAFIVKTVGDILGVQIQKVGSTLYDWRIPADKYLYGSLLSLNLWDLASYEKFIPQLYLFADVQSRFELVRGLMDTDGTVSLDGNASFTTTSKQLAVDMQTLLGSLGYRATITNKQPFYTHNGERKQGRKAFTLYIQGENIAALFALPRKKRRARISFNGGFSSVARRMVAIRPAGRAVCRCITVDHPNGLYLTDDFIVTHNSTLVGKIAADSDLRPIAFATYTGKAASVLRRKLKQFGVRVTSKTLTEDEYFENEPHFCGTIHSMIYRPILGNGGEIIDWQLREHLDRDYQLIVLDEASMISDDMLEQLQSYNIPILAVGDHAQLPPVGGMGSLVQNPDLRLERIHRQAADNPIIKLSKFIREKGDFNRKLHNGDTITFDSIRNLDRYLLQRYTGANEKRLFELATLCYTNKRRLGINLATRRVLKRSGPPVIGEQLICLKNENKKSVYNGMRGVVRNVYEQSMWKLPADIAFPEDGLQSVYMEMCIPQFLKEKTFRSYDDLREYKIPMDWDQAGSLFDFGYAITTHRFQGSQCEDVLVVCDRPGRSDDDNWIRWMYTSASRAVKRLTILE